MAADGDTARAVAELLVSRRFREEVFGFMEAQRGAFAVRDRAEQKARAESFEHPLEYTAAHSAFCDRFEREVQALVEQRGSSVEALLAGLREEEEGKTSGPLGALVEAMLTVFEYATFVEVMRDAERRDYLRKITESWARQLGVD